MLLVSVSGILVGGWIFVSQYKHLLVMLISLELISLSVLILLGLWGGLSGGEEFFILLFLGMVACEGSMGLSVLVGMVRSHGSDKFDMISMLTC